MLFFKSPLEENENGIFAKPHVLLLKIINLLIITKGAENLKLLWFETWHASFPWFYLFLLFYLIPQQLLKFLFVPYYVCLCVKNQIMSLVLNQSILAKILCGLFALTSPFSRDWKNLKLFEHFFLLRELRKTMWSCAKAGPAYTQRFYLIVPWLKFLNC